MVHGVQEYESDMRISDPNGLGHLASAQNGRAGETEAINQSLKGGSDAAGKAASSDRLQLSTFAGRLSEALATGSAVRAERVAQLKAAVQSGAYQPDPLAISRSIVDFSLAAGQK
jgi:flagellar biosynthesis anti-sigma factor FlgM